MFCTTRKKLTNLIWNFCLNLFHLKKKRATLNQLILKNEKNINKLQLAKIKRNLISDHLYSKIRSRGGQPGQLYDLAKIQKAEMCSS